MLFNQLVCNSCCSVCLSGSSFPPKIQSPSLCWIVNPVVTILLAYFKQWLLVLQIIQRFGLEHWSHSWLLQQPVNLFLFQLLLLLHIFRFKNPIIKHLVSSFTVSAKVVHSVWIRISRHHCDSVCAIFTQSSLKFRLCFPFLDLLNSFLDKFRSFVIVCCHVQYHVK